MIIFTKKNRRTMLFVPANNAGAYKDIMIFKPDTVMFDLEDAISYGEKDAARELVRRMVDTIDYNKYGIEVAVRINDPSTPFYEADLQAIVPSKANMIRLPKISSAEELLKIIADIEVIEETCQRTEPINLFCAIENALGVLNAYAIASASPRVKGIALGGADYLNDIRATRTSDRHELLFARQMIVHAGRAAKVDVFDVVYFDPNDDAGLRAEAQFVKELGFSGKSVIHPKQIAVVNDVFKPSEKQIKNALQIMEAWAQFEKSGKGVFTVNGQMVDKPIIEQAEQILELAEIPVKKIK